MATTVERSLLASQAANIFLSLETWGYLLSYIVGASMNISLLDHVSASMHENRGMWVAIPGSHVFKM